METRSSRYLDENTVTKPKISRANKNKYLYDDVNKKIGYEEIDSFSGYNGVVLDKKTPIKTREEYQKVKDYSFIYEERSDVKEKIKDEEKEKVYDINSVLEEAKKNRIIPEDVEKKRKLQSAEYSILADLNKKYISKKEKIEEELEREGIRELIDTITSKTLAKDIDDALDEDSDDLLSELMATNTLSGVDGFNLEEEIAKEILAETKENKELDARNEDDDDLVNSFYTKSMDLSEQDFEFKEELAKESKEKRKILILIVLIVLVLLGIISIYILKKINII